MKFHKTKDGKKIKLADLEISHLENIIKWIERKAREGLTVGRGGGSCAEDMWYDEETYYGEEAKSQLNFSDYKAELERRVSMKITAEEKEFIKGYATALQDLMYKLTGSNGNSKNYDPCEFYDDEKLHSYAFDLKDGGRHHPLSDYKDIDEIKNLMLKEAVEWCSR